MASGEHPDIKTVTIRFYAELNDFLKTDCKHKAFELSYKGVVTVREAIESLGVPHSAVDLVLVNSHPVAFTQRLKEGDYLSVYPVFESFDISTLSTNQKPPLRSSSFIADVHLGKLTRLLRLLGFDTLYFHHIDDNKLIDKANQTNRIILTRDHDLLKSRWVTHGYYVRSINPRQQIKEVVDKFDLYNQFKPFSRCLVCNGMLEIVALSAIKDQLNPETASAFARFFRCPHCHRIYWEGSHYHHMLQTIEKLRAGENERRQNSRLF